MAAAMDRVEAGNWLASDDQVRFSTDVGSSGCPRGVRVVTSDAVIPLRLAIARAEASDDKTASGGKPENRHDAPLIGVDRILCRFTSMTRDVWLLCCGHDEAPGVGSSPLRRNCRDFVGRFPITKRRPCDHRSSYPKA